MKKSIYTIGLCLTSITLFAQQVPNSGFETWSNFGLYQDPSNWVSANLVSSFGGEEVAQKTTDAHTGSFALELSTAIVSIMGETDTIPGMAVLAASAMQEGNGGTPFAFRPDSLEGWFKLSSPDNENFLILAILTRWDNVTNSQITVGATQFSSASESAAYQRFSAPFVYDDNGTPDTLQIIVANSMSEGYSQNVLKVDDLGFVYNTTAGLQTLEHNVTAFPNPAHDKFYLKGLNGRSAVRILNATGETVYETEVSESEAAISVESLPAGSYIYELGLEGGVSRGRFVKQ